MTTPVFGSTDWQAYAPDPLAGWSSRSTTLFDCPAGILGTESGQIAVASVPLAATSMSRGGSHEGPGAVRLASHVYRHLEDSRGLSSLLNLRDGQEVRLGSYSMLDYGDLHVYPTDMSRQVRATASEVYRLALDHSQVVLLGGEHSISYPAYLGIAEAAEKRGEGMVGYLQIDHHFDFGDQSALYGPIYQGSNARRISEARRCGPGGQSFVGVGDLTSLDQFAGLVEGGYGVHTMQDIRRNGFRPVLEKALSAMLEHVDRVYVSIDVDVCDASALPGTGNVTVGGISASEFLEIASVIRRLGAVLAALDIVEVSPRLDPSGATASVVARLLFETLLLEPVAE